MCATLSNTKCKSTVLAGIKQTQLKVNPHIYALSMCRKAESVLCILSFLARIISLLFFTWEKLLDTSNRTGVHIIIYINMGSLRRYTVHTYSVVLFHSSIPMLLFQECVKALIKSSADVNARDKNWQTPLHVAAGNNHLRCAGECFVCKQKDIASVISSPGH